MADVAMEIWGKAAGGRRDGSGGGHRCDICKMMNVGGGVNPTLNPTSVNLAINRGKFLQFLRDI
jgi:hypothetical protein